MIGYLCNAPYINQTECLLSFRQRDMWCNSCSGNQKGKFAINEPKRLAIQKYENLLCSQFVPVNPILHLQVYCPVPLLMHSPSFRHGCCMVQMSTAARAVKQNTDKCMYLRF